MDGRNSQCRIDLNRIFISDLLKKFLAEHAKKEEPNESCALLFGKKNVVSEVFLAKNIDESPVNFTIANQQLINAYSVAEKKKMEVIGIFHSHPNSEAFPSNTDKKFMECNPIVWIIYSNIKNDFRAFILKTGIKEIIIEEK